MFNFIDTERGAKADLVPLSREPEYVEAFERRIHRKFKDDQGDFFEAWCAKAEDIIVGKLIAWKEGRSAKHPNDIYALLQFDFAGLSDIHIDLDYVQRRARDLGDEVLVLWLGLVDKARAARSMR